VEKYGRAVQATNAAWRMRIACLITKATDTLTKCRAYCFPTATTDAQKRLGVTLRVHCLVKYADGKHNDSRHKVLAPSEEQKLNETWCSCTGLYFQSRPGQTYFKESNSGLLTYGSNKIKD
jgi:hypothetical protein